MVVLHVYVSFKRSFIESFRVFEVSICMELGLGVMGDRLACICGWM